MIDRPSEVGVDGRESISKTMYAIDVARNHPFEFGYRDILRNGGVEYSLENREWMMTASIPSVFDKVWAGNCVQDALLTSEYLQQNADQSAKIIIQRMDSEKIGNSITSGNHFRVLVEQKNPSGFIMETIDHSPFHSRYFSPLTDDVKSWIDLTDKEVAKLKEAGLKKIHVPASGMAYCEFIYNNNLGVAYTYMNIGKQSDNFFTIGFDLNMPELDRQNCYQRILFPISFGEINKIELKSEIDNSVSFTENDKDNPLIPLVLRLEMKDWFKELIDALPGTIEKPKLFSFS